MPRLHNRMLLLAAVPAAVAAIGMMTQSQRVSTTQERNYRQVPKQSFEIEQMSQETGNSNYNNMNYSHKPVKQFKIQKSITKVGRPDQLVKDLQQSSMFNSAKKNNIIVKTQSAKIQKLEKLTKQQLQEKQQQQQEKQQAEQERISLFKQVDKILIQELFNIQKFGMIVATENIWNDW